MRTLRQWSAEDARVPLATTWVLEDLGRALGMQELFTRQSPQKLKVLREHALIESAQSSNRIEGVEVDPSRMGTLVFGAPVYRDRNEEEVAGYQKALSFIHASGAAAPFTEQTIRKLHAMSRGESWDAGRYKEKAEPIIERRPGQDDRVRFMPVAAGPPTEAAMGELVALYEAMRGERRISALVLMAGVVLDFLCIHPFRDGNGRTSRLLTLLLCYHAGAEVGRYISLERIIEQNKERYYETLQQSSAGWHEGRHNPWPFVNYMLWVLKQAYEEFEQRFGETAEPRAKLEMVRDAVLRQGRIFRLADIERACPGVGRDWIQEVLRQMREASELRVIGRGAGAKWERIEQK